MIKDIPGYEGLYSVDDCGNVHSSYRGGRILSGVCANGYLSVHLSRGGAATTRLIHRLVAEAFIPNPENKPQINHIDGDKLNNAVANLEWVSAKENSEHRDRVVWGGQHRGGKRRTAVVCIETGKEFSSINEAARQYETNASNIRLAIRGVKHHTAGGMHWRDASRKESL